jgi:hypothetical protein
VPCIELSRALSGDGMPELADAVMHAITDAIDRSRDEPTVLTINGAPAAVIAPYGHHPQPGATAEVVFDKTAPPEARLMLRDTWGGSIRMSIDEFRRLAREGVSDRFEALASVAEQ